MCKDKETVIPSFFFFNLKKRFFCKSLSETIVLEAKLFSFFKEQLKVHSQIKGNLQRFPIYSLPPHVHRSQSF